MAVTLKVTNAYGVCNLLGEIDYSKLDPAYSINALGFILPDAYRLLKWELVNPIEIEYLVELELYKSKYTVTSSSFDVYILPGVTLKADDNAIAQVGFLNIKKPNSNVQSLINKLNLALSQA